MVIQPNGIQWEEFTGPNRGYLLELYGDHQGNPGAVDAAVESSLSGEAASLTPLFVTSISEPIEPAGPINEAMRKAVSVADLAQAIRSFGHLAVQLDPLGSPPPGDPSLELDSYGLTATHLQHFPAAILPIDPAPAGQPFSSAWEAIGFLRSIYTGAIGYDYSHILIPQERAWLRHAAESKVYAPGFSHPQNLDLLGRLTQVEVFEQFLQRTFPGRTRFSIEGVDMLIPMLDAILERAADEGICAVVIGMAHRGRLNVLTHILNMPYAEILAEFRDPGVKPSAWEELGWTGDVKYHKGASVVVPGEETVRLVIAMPANPSHLEHINPVLEGMARSADSKNDQAGSPQFFPNAALPILIHGDASFSGQGVVSETLNMSQLDGYSTGGTIHIITNNQLGYTALPQETRSSPYASDMARGLKIPIIHVNADDPLACLEAAGTAFAYRSLFHKDFMIDLVGYRRFGHNEGDEPSLTQPVMYRKIHEHPTVRALWAARLEQQDELAEGEGAQRVKQGLSHLQSILEQLDPIKAIVEPDLMPPPHGAARSVNTAVDLESLADLNQSLLRLPEGFTLNHRLHRDRERRSHAFDTTDTASIDWSHAEALALASILVDGVSIRMTGQDTVRGTFSQRHAIFYDEENGGSFCPFQSLPGVQVAFDIHNSPLSENAAIGFEFGYNIQSPERLVIWEAQYGDFINTAQAMIDEFVLSARAKWGQTPSLVLLLPHGNEGQGPDHSSGRPERFLQTGADINFRLAYPTTAAQYFHLLRRQASLLKTDPLPQVILTPKGLLRHPLTASKPGEFSDGGWQALLPVPTSTSAGGAKRLLLCTGRIYTDIVNHPDFKDQKKLRLVRVEQLYPLPGDALAEVIHQSPGLEELAWVQEEPYNMGVWTYLRPALEKIAGPGISVSFYGRPPSSSPAEGSTAWYYLVQKAIVGAALNPPEDASKLSGSGVMVEKGRAQ